MVIRVGEVWVVLLRLCISIGMCACVTTNSCRALGNGEMSEFSIEINLLISNRLGGGWVVVPVICY